MTAVPPPPPPPPPPSPPPPSAASGVDAPTPSRVVPLPGLLIGLVGMALIGWSIAQEWAVTAVWGESHTAANFTMQSLWDDTPANYDGLPIMWPLLAVLLVGIISLFKSELVAWVTIAGVVGVLVPLMFLRTVNTALDESFFDGLSLTDGIGSGVWLCLAGGVVTIIGGLVLLVPRLRARG